MKKQILILCFALVALAANSQEIKKQSKYFVGINSSSSAFTSWRYDYNKGSDMYNMQVECLNDSVLLKKIWKKTSSLIRFASDLFKTKSIDETDKYITSWQMIDRGYSSNKRLIKCFLQDGFMITQTNNKFQVGFLIGAGIHVGKFRAVNGTLEINHVWNTGAYNYLNIQLGINFSLQSLFD